MQLLSCAIKIERETVSQLGSASPSSSSVVPNEFEYHDQMSSLPDCPCALKGPYDKIGYHLVQSNLQDVGNFLPKGKKDPEGYERQVVVKRCPWWSLSMFESPDHLRRRFSKAKLSNPMVAKLIGDHFVKFRLDHTKGRISSASSNGHFEFFQYKSFDPLLEASDHQRLYP